ncbi:MAG: cation acetate symporter [Dethiobacter sp.]|jgi:cation/acetate symporter|nr:cation acetate symporter [Dethiobacter sp.]MBS3900594.1 cation acetate symporter [Dethiobacter sp.]
MSGIFIEGIIVSVLVLAVSVYFGFWGRKMTKNVSDYFVAGRSIGAVNNGLAMVSLSLSLTTFLGLTALIFHGFYLAIALYAAFTASFIGMLVLAAPYLRRHKSFTTMAFIGERFYSRNLRLLSVFIMLIVSILYLIANIKGIGIIFQVLLGLPQVYGILIGGLVVTLYVMVGGMYGVTYSQSFQSVVVLFAIFVPIMIILRALGADGWWFPPLGYGEMVPAMVNVTPHYFFPFIVHPVWYVAVFFGTFFGIIGLPHFVMRFFTVRDAKEARWSLVFCTFLVGLINTSVYALGFAGVYYVASRGVQISIADYDKLLFILTEAIAGNSWLAITVGGALAAGISTVAGLLMIMGTGIVHDLYGVLRPNTSQEKMLKMATSVMFVVGVLVTILSLRPPAFILVTIMWAFGIAGSAFGVPIVLGIWWKRTTKEGAGAGMIIGFLTSFIPYVLIEIMGWEATMISRYLYGPLGWVKVIAFSTPLTFITTIIVSWLTKEPPAEVKASVDVMHGWSDYREERYNGKLLPIIVLVLSVLSILSIFTLYDIFSVIG